MVEREFYVKKRNSKNRVKRKILLLVTKDLQFQSTEDYRAVVIKYSKEFTIFVIFVSGNAKKDKQKIEQYKLSKGFDEKLGDKVIYCDLEEVEYMDMINKIKQTL